MKKWNLLNPHRRMERFIGTFFTSAALLGVTVIGSYNSMLENSKGNIADKSIYNSEFVTSLSQQKGTIEGVYTNEDKTRAFVLLKRENTAAFDTNADHYRAFLTAAKKTGNDIHLNADPAGTLYIFGTSGYYGIYLVNNEGFQKQVLDIVMRENTDITTKKDEVDSSYKHSGASFRSGDQMQIFINPGASQTEIISALDTAEAPSVYDLYTQTVTAPKEVAIKETLETDLEQLYQSRARINEFKERLIREGVIVPEEPSDIRGDEIAESEDGSIYYKPASVVAKGYEFDWRNGSVAAGYIDTLKEDGKTDEQFFKEKQNEVSTVDKSSGEWRLTDGTALKDIQTGQNNDRYTMISSMISDLESEYNNYRAIKTKYQVTDLGSLLQLESLQKTIPQATTINAKEDFLKVYDR